MVYNKRLPAVMVERCRSVLVFCSYLRPVLEGNPHIVPAFDRYEIRKAISDRRLKFDYNVQPLELI
jgi:hypothetical protein